MIKTIDMKTILALIACAALFAACCEASNQTTQILWSGCAIAVFFVVIKVYEKYYMTDEEKNERV